MWDRLHLCNISRYTLWRGPHPSEDEENTAASFKRRARDQHIREKHSRSYKLSFPRPVVTAHSFLRPQKIQHVVGHQLLVPFKFSSGTRQLRHLKKLWGLAPGQAAPPCHALPCIYRSCPVCLWPTDNCLNSIFLWSSLLGLRRKLNKKQAAAVVNQYLEGQASSFPCMPWQRARSRENHDDIRSPTSTLRLLKLTK